LRGWDDVDAERTDFIDVTPTEGRLAAVPISRHWWQRSVLLLWAVALQLDLYNNSGYSWHFFVDGGSLLIGQHPPGMTAAGGLHLYANYPQLQFGPLTLLVTVALRPFADGGWLIITWLMTLWGWACCTCWRSSSARSGRPWTPNTTAPR
jgi:hypothetical protein